MGTGEVFPEPGVVKHSRCLYVAFRYQPRPVQKYIAALDRTQMLAFNP